MLSQARVNSFYLSPPLENPPSPTKEDVRSAVSAVYAAFEEHSPSDFVFVIKETIDYAIASIEFAPELLRALESIQEMAEEIDTIENKYRPALAVLEDYIDFFENGGI